MTHSIIKAFGTCYKKCSPRNDGSRVDQGRSVDSCGSSCVPILSRPVRFCTTQHGPSEPGLSKDPEINGLGRGATAAPHQTTEIPWHPDALAVVNRRPVRPAEVPSTQPQTRVWRFGRSCRAMKNWFSIRIIPDEISLAMIFVIRVQFWAGRSPLANPSPSPHNHKLSGFC